ncbi:hypothetical protein BGZ93_011239 [Podila epicladia]|nr:hypothetical protein BGZ92_001859 [Podila epicladia]KAG0086948.1 hypothetical protein BGZ93_011239 [Podila epicladia]
MDSFDLLCQQVFLDKTDDSTVSINETALSLVSQAQVYELPATFTPNPAWAGEKQCYRIHLESIPEKAQTEARNVLVQAIDHSVLWEPPFDRNLTGYSTKTRTEVRDAPLAAAVVLDMDGALYSEGQESETSQDKAGSGVLSTSESDHQNQDKTMLLIPTKDWLWMVSRIRFWRSESHRIKAAQRERVLDELLSQRWKDTHLAPTAVSSPPHLAGSLTVTPRSSTLPSAESLASSVASSPLPSRHASIPIFSARFCISLQKLPFQEHQLEPLVQFMILYGQEPSASSILRGLFDLIRKQLGESKVLSWTFDRANLTEQKPEVTVAFLDLLAQLGLEYVAPVRVEHKEEIFKDQQSGGQLNPCTGTPSLSQSTSYSSTASHTTAVVDTPTKKPEITSTELTWTLGCRMDDRRLEYWIHHLQQSNLPVVNIDDQSLLPSTATSSSTNLHSKSDQQKKNPIPVDVRKKLLQDRQTIAAGSIQALTTGALKREQAFVLPSSAYAWSNTSSSTPAFVKDLARWASTCGGRLDWFWSWIFSSFQKSRSKTGTRQPRANDENV